MKLCRFTEGGSEVRIGLLDGEDAVLDLTGAGIEGLQPLLENDDPLAKLATVRRPDLRRVPRSAVRLQAPIERQEIWAAGVTYLRSKSARMEESDFSATAYDRVYAAPRPELFFKALPEKVVPNEEPVGIRQDARWSVPEPELALVLNSRGRVVGYTIGNDMSSRDIEGENLLYLPQAKIYEGSCALGPWLRLGVTEEEVRQWSIRLSIHRQGRALFTGNTSVSQLKRSFADLAGFLFRSQTFPHGAVLLTGTGIVPPDDFSLQPGDVVEIEVPGIGVLRNPVRVV